MIWFCITGNIYLHREIVAAMNTLMMLFRLPASRDYTCYSN